MFGDFFSRSSTTDICKLQPAADLCVRAPLGLYSGRVTRMPGIAEVPVFIRARVPNPVGRSRGGGGAVAYPVQRPTRASPARNGREKRIAPRECERNASTAAVNAGDGQPSTLAACGRGMKIY